MLKVDIEMRAGGKFRGNAHLVDEASGNWTLLHVSSPLTIATGLGSQAVIFLEFNTL